MDELVYKRVYKSIRRQEKKLEVQPEAAGSMDEDIEANVSAGKDTGGQTQAASADDQPPPDSRRLDSAATSGLSSSDEGGGAREQERGGEGGGGEGGVDSFVSSIESDTFLEEETLAEPKGKLSQKQLQALKESFLTQIDINSWLSNQESNLNKQKLFQAKKKDIINHISQQMNKLSLLGNVLRLKLQAYSSWYDKTQIFIICISSVITAWLPARGSLQFDQRNQIRQPTEQTDN